MPWPTKWDAIFHRSAPLIMEIGFGGGHFLVELGRMRPDANVVGVEISGPSLARGLRKISSSGLTNVRIVQGDATLVLQAICVPSSISGLHLNFPDPWPKTHHARRRLVNSRFLQLAASRMSPSGILEIATDDASYADIIAELLQSEPYFDNIRDSAFVHRVNRPRTKYEQIAIREGRACHYFKWQRNDSPVTITFPIPEEFPMPHVVLNSPSSISELGRPFEPSSFTSADVHVNVLESFLSAQDEKLLWEVYVNEGSLRQRVGITVKRRPSGEFVVGLSEIGFPRVTRGIQMAIAWLAQWIVGLHPESKFLSSNLRTSIWNEAVKSGKETMVTRGAYLLKDS